MENIEKRPEQIDTISMVIHHLPSLMSYPGRRSAFKNDDWQFRKVRDEFQYFIWDTKKKKAYSWWNFKEQVLYYCMGVMHKIVLHISKESYLIVHGALYMSRCLCTV